MDSICAAVLCSGLTLSSAWCSLTACSYRDTAVSSVEAGEEDGDSVSDPSDLSSGEDDLVEEEIHF